MSGTRVRSGRGVSDALAQRCHRCWFLLVGGIYDLGVRVMTAVGFTGTRHGLTVPQLLTIGDVLAILAGGWLHHGDCLGADREVHKIAETLGIKTHTHPPASKKWRAYCASNASDQPRAYIDRNHDIVDAVDELIAAPAEMEEVVRSGTWATIRYARKKRKRVTIVYPDGSLELTP